MTTTPHPPTMSCVLNMTVCWVTSPQIWLVLWENRPLWGWKERFTHPGVTMIVLWASFQADIFWYYPMKFFFFWHQTCMHSSTFQLLEEVFNMLKSPYFSTLKRVIFSQHASYTEWMQGVKTVAWIAVWIRVWTQGVNKSVNMCVNTGVSW